MWRAGHRHRGQRDDHQTSHSDAVTASIDQRFPGLGHLLQGSPDSGRIIHLRSTHAHPRSPGRRQEAADLRRASSAEAAGVLRYDAAYSECRLTRVGCDVIQSVSDGACASAGGQFHASRRFARPPGPLTHLHERIGARCVAASLKAWSAELAHRHRHVLSVW